MNRPRAGPTSALGASVSVRIVATDASITKTRMPVPERAGSCRLDVVMTPLHPIGCCVSVCFPAEAVHDPLVAFAPAESLRGPRHGPQDRLGSPSEAVLPAADRRR